MAGSSTPPDTILISSSFFGYHFDILDALRARGRTPHWFEDRPATDLLTKSILRIAPGLLAAKSASYFARQFSLVDPRHVRNIIVIKGEALSVRTIRQMRRIFNKAHTTIYFWDSYKNMPSDTPRKVKYFDLAMTFDLHDASEDPRLIYRPLFYQAGFENQELRKPFVDLSFVGTAHTDRYRVLTRIRRNLPIGVSHSFKLYFQDKTVLWVRSFLDPRLRGAKREEFIFSPMSRQAVGELINGSRACLDIERPVQTGFSPRTIEIIGARKKLITTNPNVINEDFYCPENVLVIDRDNPVITREFLHSPFVELGKSVLSRYSIEAWIDDVLGEVYSRRLLDRRP